MFSFGGGYHTNLNVNAPLRLDAFGDVSFEYLSRRHHDDASVGIRGGLRAKFDPRVEADASIGYITYGHEDGPAFQLGSVYELTQNMGLRATYRRYSMDDFNIDQLLVGIRYYFE